MARVVIPKNKMNKFLEKLIEEYKLAAPVRDGEVLVFKEIKDAADIVLNDEITYKSPKEFLFPQVEEIMVFDEKGEVKNNYNYQKTVIFGVRPCDLEALKVMKTIFTEGKYVDVYFENRLKNTILVGFGCLSEKPGCFCGERRINKGYSSECDVFLTDCGNYYSIEIFSDNGKILLENFELDEDDNTEKEVGDGKKYSDEYSQDNILEIDADENTLFSNVDWKRLSEKCLGCGTCTFICPTCHCFEFKDVKEDGKTVRYRYWDSCMYPKFTLHASGHNPRPSKKERYRQRIMHKYVYIKKNFGYVACSGCGRCIRSCPAGMNIKSVIKDIVEEIKV
jgi:sulfhydrogenase subunit beta (sulfur reductase)